MTRIPLIPAYQDSRGVILDLIAKDNINAVTVVSFVEGAVRGNHYHKKTIQWNYVISGEVLLVSETPGIGRIERVLKKGDFVVTDKNERHALKGLKASEVLIITKGPRSGEDYELDTFRLSDPLIPN